MIYNFLIKKSFVANTLGSAVKSEIMSSQELAEKLHK